ncbi:MAG: 1-deoxy-D-xylulose-5-phosphate reductoisomerase [Burkholderiaceae bacterium]|nr:MAG: 1-deoxy-D-xylulose-5-phosphate reductoisomerase [Burkholderiaceae bacterium]
MAAVQRITVLGATGSIGLNTLDVVRRHPARFQIFALTAQRRRDELLTLCLEFKPRFAVMSDAADAQWLAEQLQQARLSTEVLSGEAGLCAVAAHDEVDTVMAAIVGAAGLPAAFAAAQAGKRVLLANKEALVMAGAIFMETVKQAGATLLPIDSEHNAIFQCLPVELQRRDNVPQAHHGISRLILTASGGPFRTLPLAELAHVTPEQACAHPNWSMGQKISVDSATMMNKGLEVIEAHWLFDFPPEQIDVLIHPQSVVHSMVEYCDGSVLAQMGQPDMRTPIANALAWPERIDAGVARLDLPQLASLTFETPDLQRFPCLQLACDVLHAGPAAAVVLNAANEICVAAFLARQIGFLKIAETIARVLDQIPQRALATLDDVLELDQQTRAVTRQRLGLNT